MHGRESTNKMGWLTDTSLRMVAGMKSLGTDARKPINISAMV
jgi:hypothetical protein